MGGGQLLTIEEMGLGLGTRESRNQCILLEQHDAVRATKPKVRDLVTLLDRRGVH